ncbi:MAG: hypothetical protein ACQCN6_03340 [Candidatus Bathyarchaeia archaeon]|jgi:hypothetical protein
MQTLKIVIYVIIIILIIAAVKTAVPSEEASKPCLVGYKAACSFTPISTVILVAAAIAVFFFTKGMFTQ